MDWNREVDRAIISDVPMDDIVITKPAKTVITQKVSEQPAMTPETTIYPKLKKIKAELDSQNNLIFQAEQQRGNLEIELSDLNGLAKITRKAELQRKIDEKTDYINRLKIAVYRKTEVVS